MTRTHKDWLQHAADESARIDRGRTAIERYAWQAGIDVERAGRDLICDVLHALEAYGEDPENEHAWAWRHYVSERDE